MKDPEQQAAEYLLELALSQGVAASTVKDGTILIFKRSALQQILNQHPDKEVVQLFIQHSTQQGN